MGESLIKCCVCNGKNTGEVVMIGNEHHKYHLSCIEQLYDEVGGYREMFKPCNIENISDGYHTFKELYEFRKVYNAALFNEWAANGKYEVYKSKRHYDGEECFGGGWFIVVAILPSGQISNHYEMCDWDLFSIPEYDKSKYEFDGHSAQDVLDRLKYIL